MKTKRIISIVMIVLTLALTFIPLTVSAEETKNVYIDEGKFVYFGTEYTCSATSNTKYESILIQYEDRFYVTKLHTNYQQNWISIYEDGIGSRNNTTLSWDVFTPDYENKTFIKTTETNTKQNYDIVIYTLGTNIQNYADVEFVQPTHNIFDEPDNSTGSTEKTLTFTPDGIYNSDGTVLGTYDNTITVKPDKYNNIILIKSGNYLYCIYSGYGFYCQDNKIYSYQKNPYLCIYKQDGTNYFTSMGEQQSMTLGTITAHNKDIYTDDTWGTVYKSADSSEYSINFPKAPPQIQLPMVVQKVGLTGVMKEILMILPLGIACLISYVGLRKGLEILRQILSMA